MGSTLSSVKSCCLSGGSKRQVGVGNHVDGLKAVTDTKLSNPLTTITEVNIHCVGDKEVAETADVEDFIKSLISSKAPTASFFVVDLMKVQQLYENWESFLPRVEVFYAVKCNSDAMIIRTLAQLGSGFDCASEWEIKLVMAQGVPASRIIYANPCKQPKEILTAQMLGVQLATFDTEDELEKLSRHAPDAKALVRIRADDPTAIASLGNKFGAEMSELPELYTKAKALSVDIVGVCFHIGTGARDPNAFAAAIALAREAFDIGKQHGFDLTILDIGGGFSSGTAFESMARAVNAALDCQFPTASGVRIIAEPGRYFMETCATLASNIFGVRERTINGVLQRDYWITDGIHGSFNPLSVGLVNLKTSPLKFSEDTSEGTISSTVYGPTLNGDDFVLKGVQLPKLFTADWFLFSNMGAYTSVLSSNFSGMHGNTDTFYIRTGILESS